MAVPTITAVLPTTVPTGGLTLIEITGTNFNVPSLPPLSAGVATPQPPPMLVDFDGVAGTQVAVVSSTRLFVLVPKSPIEPIKANNYGEGSVDVRVVNLDANGDPVPGEEATAVDGLAYARVQLASESDLTRLVRQVVREFRLQTIPNVSVSTHTDYDPDTGDLLNITGLAELPGLALIGPSLTENRFFSENQAGRPAAATPGEWLIRRVPYTVDLQFGIVGVSNLKAELTNLMAVVEGFFERNKFIELQRDPGDPAKGSVRYEIDFTEDGDLRTVGTPNTSNIRVFSGTFVIRGFDVEDLTGFPTDQEVGRTAVTDDVGVRLSSEQLGESFQVGPSPGPSGGDC